MNLKNFPKKLNSKTSCLRITVPENLDLALEGLIRKVLREQPKIDDIYVFAADYFDMLLKIRDKVGTKFSADQLCSFHNDEDAHETVKLASMFAKPGNLKTKFSEIEKTKNSDTKPKRKECSKSTGKSEKTAKNVKQRIAIQKKPGQLVEKKKNQQLNEAKPEKPEKLKLEPKTEDIGDDEEFLKSDSIKLLVEKELMDAAKSQSKDKEKERKDTTGAQQNGKSEEAGGNEDFCTEVDKDGIRTEIKKIDEIGSKAKEEKIELQGAALNKKEDVKEEGENKTLEGAIKETLYSTSVPSEGIKNQLRDNTKDTDGEAKTETQEDNFEKNEIKIENDHTESPTVEEKTKNHLENVTEAKVIIEDPIHQKASKETTETQDAAKNTSLKDKKETEESGKTKGAVKEKTQDNEKDKATNEPPLAKEVNLDPVELCSVVDILNIKPFEKDESNIEQEKKAKAEDRNPNKEEGINEVKIKAEVVINEEKEDAQTKNSGNAFEKSIDSKLANKVEVVNIVTSPSEKEAQQEQDSFIPEKSNITDEPSDTTKTAEKLKMETDAGNNKSVDKITMKVEKMEKVNPEETKPVLFENHKPTEDNKSMQDNDTAQTNKVIENVLTLEEKAAKEELKTAIENERNKVLEERLQFKENFTEASDHKEPLDKPEEREAAKASKMQLENKNFNFAESSVVKDEELQQNKTEDKPEEPIQSQEKTEELEKMNSVKNDQSTSGEPSNIIIKEQTNLPNITDQPKVEEKLRNVEVNPKKEESVKDAEDKTEGTIGKRNYEKQTEKDNVAEALIETGIAGKVDRAAEVLKESEKEKCQIMLESIKTLDEPEKKEIAKANAAIATDLIDANKIPEQVTEEAEMNLTIPGDELCTVVDSQHVIKVEEAEKLPEENLNSENVQIKTIQTHYYDTLQVSGQITKEYRVYSVEDGHVVDNMLNIANVVLPSDSKQVTEISMPLLDLPKQDDQEQYKKDLEDSLMTPSSNYSLNLSELSIQTISEMFLESEKQCSSLDKEEKMNAIKKGEKDGDEGHMEKGEVEETIHKTIVPSLIKATPVAPRDEAEINEEANHEPSSQIEKKQERSIDPNERADSSNEGRSIDNDTPFLSVEVKTVIETQNLEDEKQEKDKSGPLGGAESDVEIRIEATIDVPEGVIVNVREEKEYKKEITRHADNEPSTSETAPKDSQTSSGESESTISSTVTEIKRNDSTKKHFSSTRTLITTQSLDLDKRNPLLKTRSLSSFRQGVIDFEVWNAIEKELEEAATKIQSNFRGYKTRKKLQRENAVHITTEESSCSTTPAEPEPELREGREQSTGEFHDSIVLSEYPR